MNDSASAVNELKHARSAYLRAAASQPVAWLEWGAAAFERAAAERRPILLDIGAVWCHWCHVMDRESYGNADVAALINGHFIAIKVDRDERPDVDARFQTAVAAISGQGGWPLTVFLTPDGTPYFGGTYFPPEERYGRPGFARVLLAMSDAFRERPDEVAETAGSVIAAVAANESFSGQATALDTALLTRIVEAMVAQYDSVNGGFGSQPKFPYAGALDVLLDTAARAAEDRSLAERAAQAATGSLRRMANGGIRDQLAGGFHRYSVDERWVVPHFEKMSYDNAELLRTYAHGFASTVDPEFARVAREQVRWMDEVLCDRVQGGFYAAQDADATPDDDGDFWTWSLAEARAVLSADEMKMAGTYLDIGDVGDMPSRPEKNVLHVTKTLASVARTAGMELDAARDLLRAAEGKLRAARELRKAPFVDRTIYAGWNALCCSGYLTAGRTLKLPAAVGFALMTLDRILNEAATEGADGLLRLRRVVAYADGKPAASNRTDALLEDYAYLAAACMDAFEATGELSWFTTAERLGKSLLGLFYDADEGGFFDMASDATERLGVLKTPRKPLQDAPMPGGNSIAADVLLRLNALNGREEFRTKAEATLRLFGGVVEHFGLYAASYAKALRRLISPAIVICIIGDDAVADDLASTALARYVVNKAVLRFKRDQLRALPAFLAETLPALCEHEDSFALVCAGTVCHAPIGDAEALIDLLVTL